MTYWLDKAPLAISLQIEAGRGAPSYRRCIFCSDAGQSLLANHGWARAGTATKTPALRAGVLNDRGEQGALP
jgi:hypothetical protein